MSKEAGEGDRKENFDNTRKSLQGQMTIFNHVGSLYIALLIDGEANQ